ncbi:MAG: cupin domain-containing protein [Pseudomonadota bacterium]
MTADDIISHLALMPHPEGGHYRQTWAATNPGRPTATCIYFLLKAQERSHWHRVDAAELWLFHAGAPLLLSIAATEEGPAKSHVLGPDLSKGAPQIIVPKDHWQSAQTRGAYTLVSCVVSPGFRFDGFTLAPPGFDIATENPQTK